MGFNEFMGEKKAVSRWEVLKIGLVGAACGAAFTFVFIMLGFITV